MSKREIVLVTLLFLIVSMFIIFHESTIQYTEQKAIYERFGITIEHNDNLHFTTIKVPEDKEIKKTDNSHLFVIDKKKDHE